MNKFILQGNIKHIPAHFDETPSKPVSIENLGGLAVAESLCNKAPVEATHVHWYQDWMGSYLAQYYKRFDSKWYKLDLFFGCWGISIDHIHDDAWHRKALIKLDDIRAAIKDDQAVNHFAQLMKNKMADARAKGRAGWEDKTECNADLFAKMFVEHLYKDNSGNLLDLANLLMMIDFHDGKMHNIKDHLTMHQWNEFVPLYARKGLARLQQVINSLRETAMFEDEDGEDTNALESLCDWLDGYVANTVTDENTIAVSLSKLRRVMKGQVYQVDGGKKQVAPKTDNYWNAVVICDTPHADGDFSYLCGNDSCKCSVGASHE